MKPQRGHDTPQRLRFNCSSYPPTHHSRSPLLGVAFDMTDFHFGSLWRALQRTHTLTPLGQSGDQLAEMQTPDARTSELTMGLEPVLARESTKL